MSNVGTVAVLGYERKNLDGLKWSGNSSGGIPLREWHESIEPLLFEPSLELPDKLSVPLKEHRISRVVPRGCIGVLSADRLINIHENP